jgi:uncharacterized protein (DUF1778 family)
MPDTVKAPDQTCNARLEAHVQSDQKDFFQRSATLAGQALEEFVIESTQQATVVQEHELIRLSREEQIAFVSALLTPSKPGARLCRAAENYRKKSGL